MQIGMKAPEFDAITTMGRIKLNDYAGKWLVLFSHPGDFTPVCTTEFIAFAQCYEEFINRGINLIGLSVDGNPSHLAWVKNIEDHTGIRIPFPIIDDLSMRVARDYDMISEYASTTKTVRNVYIIDPNQIIRLILVYPLNVGRNINEIIRCIDALQIADREKVATPANWLPGLPTVLPAPTTYDELLERERSSNNCLDWYLCFKQ
ncbi:MAG: peroxiredoxin [Clostridiales bacterium]|jgi:peroxiredoxin (alkyl hydroperoxide reductase subunit C)|nr:peroxiredoxin [Clostridiales bacterium]